MAVGDILSLLRVTSYQPAGTNVFVILQTFNDGDNRYFGIQDGTTNIGTYITATNGQGMTKFHINNTNYYFCNNVASGATGVQVQ